MSIASNFKKKLTITNGLGGIREGKKSTASRYDYVLYNKHIDVPNMSVVNITKKSFIGTNH